MASVCLSEKSKGKPDAGNLHVRFDEGEGYSLPTLLWSVVKKISEESIKPRTTRNTQKVFCINHCAVPLFW